MKWIVCVLLVLVVALAGEKQQYTGQRSTDATDFALETEVTPNGWSVIGHSTEGSVVKVEWQQEYSFGSTNVEYVKAIFGNKKYVKLVSPWFCSTIERANMSDFNHSVVKLSDVPDEYWERRKQ